MITKKFGLCILFFLLTLSDVFSQPSQFWIQYFTNGVLEYTRDITKDNNGNYLITGTSVVSSSGYTNYGVVTIKYDSSGNKIWVRTKDDSSSISDDPYQILIDDSNNIYIFGILETGKFFLMKYDAEGNEKWNREFNSSINYYEVKDRACIDEDGSIYCAGAVESNNRKLTFVRKYSSIGDVVWYKEFEDLSTITDEPCNIIYDGNEFLYMAGVTAVTDINMNHYITKFDKNGHLSWAKNYGSDTCSYRKPVKIILANDSNLYLMGTSLAQPPDFDFNIIKLDSAGNKIWENFFGGTANRVDYPNDIIVDLNLDIYVTGSLTQLSPPYSLTTMFVINKYSSNGDLNWTKILGDSLELPGDGYSLGIDQSNNLYVAGGISHISHQSTYDMLIQKYNPDGDIIWSINKDFLIVDDTPVKIIINSEDDFTAILNGLKSFVTMRYSKKPQDIAPISLIDKYELRQNYPNPFNPNTSINYSIPQTSNVKIEIFDILGNKIHLLVDEYKNAGDYSINFNGSELSSGIYFYRLITDKFLQTKKMLLLK